MKLIYETAGRYSGYHRVALTREDLAPIRERWVSHGIPNRCIHVLFLVYGHGAGRNIGYSATLPNLPRIRAGAFDDLEQTARRFLVAELDAGRTGTINESGQTPPESQRRRTAARPSRRSAREMFRSVYLAQPTLTFNPVEAGDVVHQWTVDNPPPQVSALPEDPDYDFPPYRHVAPDDNQ